jgi:hypothetical protein
LLVSRFRFFPSRNGFRKDERFFFNSSSGDIRYRLHHACRDGCPGLFHCRRRTRFHRFDDIGDNIRNRFPGRR